MAIRRIEPGPGQESVWDYPRPPRLEASSKHIQIYFNSVLIADSHRSQRVLETSHPPTWYIPMDDVRMEYLSLSPKGSYCEWKGQAVYYTVNVDGVEARDAVWSYPRPTPSFAGIKDYLAFYPSRMEACLVDGERVQAQAGDFYGGWITSEIVGPFKGEPGTWGW